MVIVAPSRQGGSIAERRSDAYSVHCMAVPVSSSARKANRRRSAGQSAAATSEPQSGLQAIRIERRLTQTELATRAGMHRNSIRKLEDGTTHEVTSENASALAAALKVSVPDLGLRVRSAADARSIRFRRLSPEQRELVDDLLSLPPEDYVLVRGAIERLREERAKRSRGGRR
jgi:transcriptional regulator with XRE-family HTH domain